MEGRDLEGLDRPGDAIQWDRWDCFSGLQSLAFIIPLNALS